MFYLKVKDKLYPATFTGKMKDREWDDRPSKTITLSLPYEEVKDVLTDDTPWSIYEKIVEKRVKIDPETGMEMFEEGEVVLTDEGDIVYDDEGNMVHEQIPVTEDVDVSREYDNSEYSVLGDTTIAADGTVSIKMGKPTDLEVAYQLLYGGM